MSTTRNPDTRTAADFDPFAPPVTASDPVIYTAVRAGVYAAPVRRRAAFAAVARIVAIVVAVLAFAAGYAYLTAGVVTAVEYAGATVAGLLILAGWMLVTGVLTVAVFMVYTNRVHGHSFR